MNKSVNKCITCILTYSISKNKCVHNYITGIFCVLSSLCSRIILSIWFLPSTYSYMLHFFLVLYPFSLFFLYPLQLFVIQSSPTFTAFVSFISFYFFFLLFLFFFFLSWFLSFTIFYSFLFMFSFVLYPASTKVFTSIFFSLFSQMLATLTDSFRSYFLVPFVLFIPFLQS